MIKVSDLSIDCPSYSFFKNEEEEKSEFTDLQNHLSEISEINRIGIIAPDLLTKTEDLIDQKLETDNPQKLLEILAMISTYNYCGSRKYVYKIIDKFKQIFPDTELYFKGKDKIITPEGVKIILNKMQAKNDWPDDAVTCHDVENLPSLIEEVRSSLDHEINKGWVLSAQGTDHLTPVYIQTRGKKCKILISDSQGLSGEKVILTQFKKIFQDDKNMEVFVCSSVRQKDGCSCPVFSILDLDNIIYGNQCGRDIFEFFKENIHLKAPRDLSDGKSLKVWGVDTLPPEMMKVTQSIRELTKYRKESTDLCEGLIPVKTKISPTGDITFEFQNMFNLYKRVDESSTYNEDGYQLNKYIEKKYFLFTQIIIQFLVNKTNCRDCF